MGTLIYMRTIILVAIVIFLVGIYRNLLKKVIRILQTQQSIQAHGWTHRILPFLKLVLDEVIVQRRISSRSRIVWVRHLMIFGGFVVFFAIEFLIGLTKNHQAFNFMRPIFKIGLDVSGLVLILGLTIALTHRMIHRKEEKEFTDIKSLVLLVAVVISGLLSSGCRALLSPESAPMANSFLQQTITGLLSFLPYPLEDIHYWLFLIHITIAAAVVAYIPFSKLIHMFATPIGRLVTLGEDFPERKRTRVSEGLL